MNPRTKRLIADLIGCVLAIVSLVALGWAAHAVTKGTLQ
jgi:hypothetical protein